MKTGFSQMKCGLLGERLGHSFSPLIHNMLADYEYKTYEITQDRLEDFVKNGGLDAFNVTIPYKKAVIPFIDEISPEARSIGAINVIARNQGRLYGYNTDYFGFEYMLDSAKLCVAGKKALLIGNGGAAATVKAVLTDRNIGEIVIINSKTNTTENLMHHSDASIIINASPVGMYPNNRKSPIDISIFSNCEAVLDIVYNPAKTELMLQAEERGIIAIGGLSMLVAQAAKGFEIFTDEKYENGIIEKIIDHISRKTQNIILIGMPSCGKSTIGKILAKELSRTFLDADDEFKKMHGITPAEAINTLGEATFRDMESTTLAELGKLSGALIATGGGAVTRKQNYPSLHQNGIIVYIKRDIDKLSTEGRPLSKKGSLNELYEKRKAFYEAFADITVENNDSATETVRNILCALDNFDYSCIYNSKKEI